MNKLCIIGVGLIGGAIGIDAKRLGLAKEITGVVRRPESIKESIRMGAVTNATMDITEGIKGADLIILAVPLSMLVPIAKKIKGTKTAVIDVASVKGRVTKDLEKILGRRYLGTHPMAGSEKKGVGASRPGIFKDAVCIITPKKKTDKDILEKVTVFWKELGSRIILTTPEKHDMAVALISHVPHLIAASLVNALDKDAELCIGPGFRDTTRIASGPPELWQEICRWNRNSILKNIKKFKNELIEVENSLNRKNWNKLLVKLQQAKGLRDKWK